MHGLIAICMSTRTGHGLELDFYLVLAQNKGDFCSHCVVLHILLGEKKSGRLFLDSSRGFWLATCPLDMKINPKTFKFYPALVWHRVLCGMALTVARH